MTEESSYEKGLMHGQHSKRFYWILGGSLLAVGMIAGLFIAPDEWPVWRQLLAGGLFGLWSGFCVFAWHLLLYGTVEE